MILAGGRRNAVVSWSEIRGTYVPLSEGEVGDLRRYMPEKNKKESEMGLLQDCCHLALQQFSCDYCSSVTDVKVEVWFEKTSVLG